MDAAPEYNHHRWIDITLIVGCSVRLHAALLSLGRPNDRGRPKQLVEIWRSWERVGAGRCWKHRRRSAGSARTKEQVDWEGVFRTDIKGGLAAVQARIGWSALA